MALYIYLKKKAAAMRAAVTQAVNAARTGSKIILPSSKWAGGRTGMALAIFLKKRATALEQAAKQAKAAVRKAAAQKIGKKIGKTVAQSIAQKIKTQKAIKAWYAKRQRPQIQRPNPSKKQTASKLFPGAERSRIIPYSESSRHSYYGPKSHKLQNEGYMVDWQKKHYNSLEAYNDRKLQYVLSHPAEFRKK